MAWRHRLWNVMPSWTPGCRARVESNPGLRTLHIRRDLSEKAGEKSLQPGLSYAVVSQVNVDPHFT